MLRLRSLIDANVNRRLVCGGYIRRGLSAVGARRGWVSAGRGNAAQKCGPGWPGGTQAAMRPALMPGFDF
jgi:hypothetical protein